MKDYLVRIGNTVLIVQTVEGGNRIINRDNEQSMFVPSRVNMSFRKIAGLLQ